MELVFPGECTVEVMEEIKDSLLTARREWPTTELVFERVERADLSFFQLLHVAERAFREAGKELLFRPDLPARLSFKATVTNWSRLVAPLPGAQDDPSPPSDPC